MPGKKPGKYQNIGRLHVLGDYETSYDTQGRVEATAD